MAVTAQEHVDPQAQPQAARAARPVPVWTRPHQLRQAAPVLLLVARIWSIPEVTKLGLLVDGSGIHIHVFIADDDRDAEHRIFDAERDYLNTTPLHNFDLNVTPIARLPESMSVERLLVGFETILER